MKQLDTCTTYAVRVLHKPHASMVRLVGINGKSMCIKTYTDTERRVNAHKKAQALADVLETGWGVDDVIQEPNFKGKITGLVT